MIGQNGGLPVRPGRSGLPRLEVPGEIFTHYQPVIGAAATLVWLNLRYALCAGRLFDPGLLKAAGLDEEAIDKAIDRLVEYELVLRQGDGYIVNEPLSREAFAARFGSPANLAAASERSKASAQASYAENSASEWSGTSLFWADGEIAASGGGDVQTAAGAELRASSGEEAKPVMRSPLSKRRKASRMLRLVEPAAAKESENPDMQAVLQIYHKKIGMIGPTQYEKLRFWIEEMGMEGAVVALAIEETVRSADVPRIQYLEGILRNWYNDGIRTLADLHEKRRVSRVLSGDDARPAKDRSLEGTPNASAYQSVSAELVARWKELYPDEYDS